MTFFEGRGIFSITMPPDSTGNNGNRSPPFPRRKSSKSVRSQKKQDINTIQNDEENDLDLWVTRAKTGKDISKCNPELVPELVQELNNQWEYNITTGNYFESEYAYNGFKAAQKLQKEISNKNLQQTIKDDLKKRKAKTKDGLKDLDEMVQIQSENMEKQFANEIEQLMNKHDKEIQQFNEKWKTVKQRLYNKPSARLNLLQQQEDKLNYAHRFEESYAISKLTDKLEKVEAREQGIKMEYDYRDALRIIIQRQREEMRVLLSNHEDMRKLHQGAKKCEEDLIETRVKKIDREIEKADDFASIQRRQLKYERGLDESSKFSLNSFARANNKSIFVSEFNEIALPPLNAEQKIQRAIMKRTTALSPREKGQFQYDFSLTAQQSLSMSMPRPGSIIIPNQSTTTKSQSQSNSPRGKSQKRKETNFV